MPWKPAKRRSWGGGKGKAIAPVAVITPPPPVDPIPAMARGGVAVAPEYAARTAQELADLQAARARVVSEGAGLNPALYRANLEDIDRRISEMSINQAMTDYQALEAAGGQGKVDADYLNSTVLLADGTRIDKAEFSKLPDEIQQVGLKHGLDVLKYELPKYQLKYDQLRLAADEESKKQQAAIAAQRSQAILKVNDTLQKNPQLMTYFKDVDAILKTQQDSLDAAAQLKDDAAIASLTESISKLNELRDLYLGTLATLDDTNAKWEWNGSQFVQVPKEVSSDAEAQLDAIRQEYADLFKGQDVDETIKWAESNPDDFVTEMRYKGRTPQTEALLKDMFPDITDDQMDNIFSSPSARDLMENRRLTRQFKEFFPDVKLENFAEWVAKNGEDFASRLRKEGRNSDTVGFLKELNPDITDEQIDALFNPPQKQAGKTVVPPDNMKRIDLAKALPGFMSQISPSGLEAINVIYAPWLEQLQANAGFMASGLARLVPNSVLNQKKQEISQRPGLTERDRNLALWKEIQWGSIKAPFTIYGWQPSAGVAGAVELVTDPLFPLAPGKAPVGKFAQLASSSAARAAGKEILAKEAERIAVSLKQAVENVKYSPKIEAITKAADEVAVSMSKGIDDSVLKEATDLLSQTDALVKKANLLSKAGANTDNVLAQLDAKVTALQAKVKPLEPPKVPVQSVPPTRAVEPVALQAPAPAPKLSTEVAEVKTVVKAKETPVRLPEVKGALTPKQTDQVLKFFGQTLESRSAESRRAATIELRKHILAERAAKMQGRVQELVIGGTDAEAALKQAQGEIMSGKLPDVTTGLYEEITDEMRAALFAKVYEVLKDEPFELMSTSEALSNALRGQSIPRTPGAKGGSAYSRLQRVFGKENPEVLKAIDQGKSLEDVIEGQFREHTDPIPIDQETAEYLRNLPTYGNQETIMMRGAEGAGKFSAVETNQLRLELQHATDNLLSKPYEEWTVPDLRTKAEKELALKEIELRVALAEKRITKDEFDLAIVIERDKVHPYPPVTQYEAPITKEIKAPSMFPVKDRILLVRALKYAGLTAQDIGNFMRGNMASFDFSWWRQAAPLLAKHPQEFVTANIRGWKGMWDRAAAEASWEKISRRDPLFQIYEEGADFLRPLDLPKGTKQWQGVEEFGFLNAERPIPKFTAKIPWVKVSSRGFSTSINEFLWQLYHNHYSAMLKVNEKVASGKIKMKPGEAFSISKEMVDYSKYLADLSGRAQLGKAGAVAPVANAMFFSLRLNLGRILTPRHLISANPYIRKEAWKDLSLFVGTMGGAIMVGKGLGLWDVETDPRSADFMKIRVGNTRIDPWGGYQQYVTFFSRVITKTGIVSTTGAEYEIDPIAATTKLIRGKASPFAGIIADMWTGKTFLGDEVDLTDKKQWISRIAPFALMDMYEAFNEKGVYGAMMSVPGIVGFSAQTYSGDWKDNKAKLGLPKYSDNLPFNVTEPKYDASDFWSDHAAEFKGVDPVTLTESKAFPPIIRGIAEAQQILDGLKDVINQPLTSLNADPKVGNTYAEYYKQWQARSKITDADKLKAFDSDDRTKNAKLGNMTQRQFVLLEQYHKLEGAEQRQFLKDNPELNNPRTEWLKANPLENAKLAVFGQAKILTQKAYDAALKLAKELDIPENALPNFPPKDIATDYFSWEKVTENFDDQSAEAKLIVAKADARTNGAMSKYLNRKLVTTPIPSLELQVKNRDLNDAYADLEDDKAREDFRKTHPEWIADNKRIESYNNEGEKYADLWAEHGKLVLSKGDNTAEDKLWFVDHEDVYDWAVKNELKKDTKDEWDIPSMRIDVKFRAEDKEYDAIDAKAKNAEGVLLRDVYLKDIKNVAYAKARIERTGFQMGLNASLISQWVEYNQLPEYGAWRERYRKEHPEFDSSVKEVQGENPWADVPEKIPVQKYDDIYEQFKTKFKEYDNVQGTEKEREAQRDAIFDNDPKFKEAWYRREAYGMLLPEDKFGVGNDGKRKNFIDLFVEYALLPDKGFERERILLNNPEFDALLEADVPENVPDEQFDIITKKYQSQFNELDKLEGDAREKRANELRFKTTFGNETKVEYTEFGVAELTRDAYKAGVPAELIKDYVDYKKLQNEKSETKSLIAKNFKANEDEYEKLSEADRKIYLKRNETYAAWKKQVDLPNYDDDWYLLEHPEFANKYYPSKMADFKDELKVDGKVVAYGNVPSRDVFNKYLEYYRTAASPQALRLTLRRNNLDLDAWLVRAYDMTPIGKR